MPGIFGVVLPAAGSLLKLVPDAALGSLEGPGNIRYRVSLAEEYLYVSAVGR